ncbi:hypothetical protein GCM10007989_34150 [Devosia pacifica]|uniref:Metallopeptidase n=1 Tax=Devosia pacifica TaxID=1335967 RepID=A0A918SDW6_9HYPH|nr:DUF4344 domain-containing metallopeptidase [Devosia pacifica]GHA35381.1 hypothetical protein GCM10007989_34150 [Devosia pacifica]
MSRILAAFLLSVTLLLGAVTAADAQQIGKKSRAAANAFAAHNSLFVLYHEMGHLLIDQFSLPVLGREEDAADNMASWFLLKQTTPDSHQVLADAAYGWLLSGIAYGTSFADADYYAGHSLDRQRAYQIVCLMVGSNAREFRSIANAYSIDRNRQLTCEWDYDLIDRSLTSLIGQRAGKKASSAEVEVTYQEAPGRLQPAAEAFRQSGIFERIATELRDGFPLPRGVTLTAKRCAEANAFYDPNTVEIIFCYELMEDFFNLAIKDMRATGRLSLGPGGLSRLDQ